MIWSITEVRNAKSINEDNSALDMEINHPELGWIPYSLNAHDPDNSISNEQLLDLVGSNYAAYVPPTSEEVIAEQAAIARAERQLAFEHFVDPIVSNNLRWQSLTDAQRQTITDYRQQLLDISEQSGWPHTINWPTPPDPNDF